MEYIYHPIYNDIRPRSMSGRVIAHYECEQHEGKILPPIDMFNEDAMKRYIQERTLYKKDVIDKCDDCKRTRERTEKADKEYAVIKNRQLEYERERSKKQTLLNRIHCFFFLHCFQEIGLSVSERSVNAGSWSGDMRTDIFDCQRCGKRKRYNP